MFLRDLTLLVTAFALVLPAPVAAQSRHLLEYPSIHSPATPGGSTIPTTVVQVIVNAIDYGLNVDEAKHQPRIHQGTTATLRVEPNFNPDTVAALKAKGHRITSDETMEVRSRS